jgi:hypothetical protein
VHAQGDYHSPSTPGLLTLRPVAFVRRKEPAVNLSPPRPPIGFEQELQTLETRFLLSSSAHVVHASAHHHHHHARAALVIPFRSHEAFSVPVPSSVGRVTAAFLLTGDFNGDGRPDLLEIASGPGDPASRSAPPRSFLALLLNRGNGTFIIPPASTDIVLAGGVTAAVVGDFNRDGTSDVVLSITQTDLTHNTFATQSLLYRGDRAGFFRTGTFLLFDPFETVVAAGDFNGDRNLDLISQTARPTGLDVRASTPVLRLRLGDGAGNFSAARITQLTPPIQAPPLTDFNGDGRFDLVSIEDEGTIQVWLT